MDSAMRERLRARFEMLDANGNGYIQPDDFELVASRLLAAFKEPTGSEKAQAVNASHRAYWQSLASRLDADNDGRVSFEEYLAGVGDTEQFGQAVQPYAAALVALADRDNDGYVQRDEFGTGLRALGFDQEGIKASFASLDPKGDGRVSVQDWADFITGFYTAQGAHPSQRLVTG